MAAFAFGARPRLFGAGMLIGLVLALVIVAAPEPQRREARIEFRSWNIRTPKPLPELRPEWTGIAPSDDADVPPNLADARDWPRGMVMGRRYTPIDHMDAEVVVHWLSGLLRWLASGAA